MEGFVLRTVGKGASIGFDPVLHNGGVGSVDGEAANQKSMILKTQRNPPGCSTLLPVTQESRFSVCSTTPIIKAQWRRKDSAEGGHKETSLAAYYTEIASDLSILLGLSPETSD